jgi:hypothetical protein
VPFCISKKLVLFSYGQLGLALLGKSASFLILLIFSSFSSPSLCLLSDGQFGIVLLSNYLLDFFDLLISSSFSPSMWYKLIFYFPNQTERKQTHHL